MKKAVVKTESVPKRKKLTIRSEAIALLTSAQLDKIVSGNGISFESNCYCP